MSTMLIGAGGRSARFGLWAAAVVTAALGCGGSAATSGSGGAGGAHSGGGGGAGGMTSTGAAGATGGSSSGAGGMIPIGGTTGVYGCTPGVEQLIITDCGYTDAGFSAVSNGDEMTAAGDFGRT